jgi:hypothetical protein
MVASCYRSLKGRIVLSMWDSVHVWTLSRMREADAA